MNEITDNVWIGRWHSHHETSEIANSFVGVVNVCVAFDSTTDSSTTNDTQVKHLHLPILDLTAPTNEQLREAVEFIERRRALGPVLIHCKAGFSRSAAVAAAWLVSTGRETDRDDAFDRLRIVRPQIVIRPEIAKLDLPGTT